MVGVGCISQQKVYLSVSQLGAKYLQHRHLTMSGDSLIVRTWEVGGRKGFGGSTGI